MHLGVWVVGASVDAAQIDLYTNIRRTPCYSERGPPSGAGGRPGKGEAGRDNRAVCHCIEQYFKLTPHHAYLE